MTSFIVKGEEYLVNLAKQAASGIASVFVKDVEPALEAFIHQFTTDFGALALQEAAALAPAVKANPSSILTVGADLVSKLASKAGGIAAQDALTVALNALRVHVTAINPPATASIVGATIPDVTTVTLAPAIVPTSDI